MRARLEALGPADERYLTTPALEQTMHMTAVAVVDGDPLRGPDGAVDRALVRSLVEAGWPDVPHGRERLRRPPLGLTAPVWVPDTSTTVDDLLRWREGSVAPEALLAAVADAVHTPMDLARPPWRITAVELADGDVAMIVNIHHVAGDGRAGTGVVYSFFRQSPAPPSAPAAPAAPPHRVAVPAMLALQWWREQEDLAAAVADYRSRPLSGRVRRVVGRNVRPVRAALARSRRGAATGPSAPSLAVRTVSADYAAARRRARELGGTLTAAVAVATGRGAAELSGGDGARPSVVPVLLPAPTGDGTGGNSIRMQQVGVPGAGELAEGLRAVREQLADPAAGAGGAGGAAGLPPYATVMPAQLRPLRMGPAEVRRMLFFPVVDPRQPVGALGYAYRDEFCVGVLAHGEELADAVAGQLAAVLRADAEGAR